MKKYVVQVETNLDLFDLAKILDKYEKLGAIKLLSVIENQNRE